MHTSTRRRPALATSLAASLTAVSALVATPAAAAEPPRTGFEQRGGASFTTLEEEQAFLAEVDRLSDRVFVQRAGTTAQGRPLQIVALGAPAPPSPAAIADGSSIFFTCSQHGDEPAGREACLSTIRNLAFTEDPALVEQLGRTTMLFLPNANPDGRAADTRENSQDLDINRDHIELDTAEAQVIARVQRDLDPDLVADLHEFGPREFYDEELLYLWPRNLNVDDEIHDLSRELSLDYVGAGAADAGYTHGVYGILRTPDGEPIRQIAGDEQARILRNMAGLRHSLSILVETAEDPLTPAEEDPTVLNNRRVDTQLQVVSDILRFFRDHTDEIEQATETAPIEAAEEGAERDTPVYFGGADNQMPTEEEQVAFPPPCGYLLTPAQAAPLQEEAALHGITYTVRGDGVFVPMAQPLEPVIPLVLDERARYELVTGQPLQDC